MMKRREFCRQLALTGGAVLLAPLLNSCASEVEPTATRAGQLPVTAPPTVTRTPWPESPSPPAAATAADPTQAPSDSAESIPENTPQSAPASAAPVATVALVKTTDRALGVRRALELFGRNPVRGSQVLLKPNYNSADAAPASTHPEILRSLVRGLNDMGAQAITVGERSGMGDTRAVLTQTGVFDLGDELGFDTVVFDELDEKAWVVHQSADFHWPSGFAVPKILLDSECVVQTCNLKTHRYGGHFTLSLKNSVGFVARTVRTGGYNYMSELHNSPYQRQMIAEINAAYAPALIVLDGVEAFVTGGPANGKLVSPGVILAGSDPVAIDAVGVAILRMFGTTPDASRGKVFEQAQIVRAVELGLGVAAPEQIQIVTGDPQSEAYAKQISQYLS